MENYPQNNFSNNTPIDSQPIINPQLPTDISNKKQHNKLRWPIFVTGLIISATLLTAAIVIDVTFIPNNSEGKSLDEINSEISALDPQISEAESIEALAFYNKGFSDDYYNAANKTYDLKEARLVLQKSAFELTSFEKTPLSTGSLAIYIAAAIFFIISMILLFAL